MWEVMLEFVTPGLRRLRKLRLQLLLAVQGRQMALRRRTAVRYLTLTLPLTVVRHPARALRREFAARAAMKTLRQSPKAHRGECPVMSSLHHYPSALPKAYRHEQNAISTAARGEHDPDSKSSNAVRCCCS